MQAEAKLLRRRFGPDAAIVYIGSCIAAKNECDQTPGLTDYALTYDELNADVYKRQAIKRANHNGKNQRWVFPISSPRSKRTPAPSRARR